MTGGEGKGAARRRGSELLTLSLFLALSAAGCLVVYAARAAISGRLYYTHLLGNLALSFVPYLVAAAATLMRPTAGAPLRGRRALLLGLAAALWLLFYPNAPYIFTDFIHVINKSYIAAPPGDWMGLKALIWYDLVMNAAFAFVGHFAGLVSMWLVERSLRRAWGRAAGRTVVVAAIALSGLGIYLGRFSRLNSWDAISSPDRVVREILEAFSDPEALIFSTVFGLFIGLSYGALASFKRLDSSD